MQTQLCRCFVHGGESTANLGEVTGAHRRGIPQPRTGSTSGENDVLNRAEVVYVISRQIQFIVIGAHATDWSGHRNTNLDANWQRQDPYNSTTWPQGLSVQQQDESTSWKFACNDNVPDTEPELSTNVTTQEDEGHRVKPATDKVLEHVSSKTKDATPKRGPNQRTRATLKLRRKRTKRKLKLRAARRAEEVLWRAVEAEKQVIPKGLGNAPQQGTDFSTRHEQFQPAQDPTSTGATQIQKESLSDSGGKVGNQNGQVVNLVSDAKSRWVASREQLKIFLWHFWQEHPCDGEDQNEFDRLNLAIKTSPDWESAKQCLQHHMIHEGIESDKVEQLAANVLSEVFF
jgi:hypothetical protein